VGHEEHALLEKGTAIVDPEAYGVAIVIIMFGVVIAMSMAAYELTQWITNLDRPNPPDKQRERTDTTVDPGDDMGDQGPTEA
jgi:hypothetical protein